MGEVRKGFDRLSGLVASRWACRGSGKQKKRTAVSPLSLSAWRAYPSWPTISTIHPPGIQTLTNDTCFVCGRRDFESSFVEGVAGCPGPSSSTSRKSLSLACFQCSPVDANPPPVSPRMRSVIKGKLQPYVPWSKGFFPARFFPPDNLSSFPDRAFAARRATVCAPCATHAEEAATAREYSEQICGGQFCTRPVKLRRQPSWAGLREPAVFRLSFRLFISYGRRRQET